MKSATSIGALSNISLPSSLSASVSLYSGAGPSFQLSSNTSSLANHTNSNNILDKNLIRPKFEVSHTIFYIFCTYPANSRIFDTVIINHNFILKS